VPFAAFAAPSLSPLRLLLVVLAAAGGSAMNAVAGGGTLLTFPALVALGVPPLVANATSTVALWPGGVGGLWGYRGEVRGARRWALWFAMPSLLGGLAGARLLLITPADRFEELVPFLVFGATVLFVIQRPVMLAIASRRQRLTTTAISDAEASGQPLPPPPLPFLLYQFAVAVYGGYFGAGAGIFMLAALGFMGLTNIHRMNGLKLFGGMCINLVAATTFAVSGIVDWPVALAMAVGAILGGYHTSGLAQRFGQVWVRRSIAAIGFGSGLWLLVRVVGKS
jgi:uncharacterized membrane protein YfcA